MVVLTFSCHLDRLFIVGVTYCLVMQYCGMFGMYVLLLRTDMIGGLI